MKTIMDKIKFAAKVILWAFRYPLSPVGRAKVLLDYLRCYRRRGITMDEYYEFEFERRPKAFRDSFLGVREQRYYLEQLNPVKYFILARNKYLAHRMLESAGIRTSSLYCYYEPMGKVVGSAEIATNVADVAAMLEKKHVVTCVVKSTEGSHGDDVLVVKSIDYMGDDARLHLHDGTTMALSKVLENGPRIFESLISQTEQFSSFNPSSVNTVRFMTTLYPDGSARVIATFAKIGRIGRCVDNAGSGGNVDACIDVESGRIIQAVRFDGVRRMEEIDAHPDSGAALKGEVVAGWNEIKAQVARFQQAFPWCKAAGWDIAITEEGPVVIEVNDMWDRTGQMFVGHGWRKEIRDCYKAWHAAGYRAYRGRLENDFTMRRCKRLFEGEFNKNIDNTKIEQ